MPSWCAKNIGSLHEKTIVVDSFEYIVMDMNCLAHILANHSKYS